jgi:O-methyltransferase
MKVRIGERLSRMGYVVYRMEPSDGPIRPMATYSPWNQDSKFLEVYKRIDGYTLIDKLRLWELWSLVDQSKKLTGSIIEVGAWRGGSAALMATRAALSGISSNIIVCDTFKGVVKAGDIDSDYGGGEHADTSRKVVEELFKKMKLDNVRILEGVFPDATGSLIDDESFRLCHIDVDTYESAAGVTRWVWPRLVVGGMVVHDDYGFRGTAGITRHVDEQMEADDRIILYNLNGHAVIIKIK